MFKLPVFRTPISNSFSTNSLVVYLCGSQYHLIIDNLLFFSMDGNKIVQLVCGDFDMPIEFKHFSLNRTSNNENTWFPFKYPCIVSNPLCIVNEIISIFPLLFPLARFFLLISIALFRLYTFIRFRSFSFNRSLVCVRSVGFLKSFSQNPIYSFSAQLFLCVQFGVLISCCDESFIPEYIYDVLQLFAVICSICIFKLNYIRSFWVSVQRIVKLSVNFQL